MKIDPSMLGRLRDVRPLNEVEREDLWNQMQTPSDRSAFKRIEAGSNAIRDAVQVTGDGEGALAVGEFAKEFADRIEARDLRVLAIRTKDRGQERTAKRSR